MQQRERIEGEVGSEASSISRVKGLVRYRVLILIDRRATLVLVWRWELRLILGARSLSKKGSSGFEYHPWSGSGRKPQKIFVMRMHSCGFTVFLL
jgi:hypothetical protein